MKGSNTGIHGFISDRQRKFEITGVVLTGLGKFAFMDFLEWKFLFISIAILVWATYVVYQNQKVGGILNYWGFRRDNFVKVTLSILPFGAVFILIFFIVGYYQGTLTITWHVIPILILYPIWGIIQQFLVIGLVAGNLQDLQKFKLNKFVIILFTAILFGVLHYPYYWLMVGTFILALLYGFIYLKERNVYAMGLFHGGLGALFFYTVVGRDPFEEVFGKLFLF
jgi:membrane protease YdiL (CAAX protease family)